MSSFEERMKKYGKLNKHKDEIIRFNFDISMMGTFLAYCLSENKSIHRASMIMMRDVFLSIKEELFENNYELISIYQVCLKILNIKLDRNLHGRDLVIREVVGIMGSQTELDLNNVRELSDDEVFWVESTISTCANITFINNEIYELSNICTGFTQSSYSEKENYANQLEAQVEKMYRKFSQNKAELTTTKDTVDLHDYSVAVSDIYDKRTGSDVLLQTGMQAWNDILAGGFAGGRVYSIFGLPGEGKTITLINLAYQIKEFNKGFKPKDPTKIPTVLLLTMENKASDVFETLFNIACAPKPVREFTKDQVMQMVASKLSTTPQSPINIVIRYKPNQSVNTSYLHKLTDDLANQGYEVIAVIQDYIKRIRPVDYTGDMRLDMGAVINDFSNFAKQYDIPVITASQFNREGVRTIDTMRGANKSDLVKNLGRAMIGESGLIDENLDCTIFITPEWIPSTGQKFMGVKCTKTRYQIFTQRISFYQPFYDNNKIKYVTDVGLPEPKFLESISDIKMAAEMEMVKNAYSNSRMSKYIVKPNKINDVGFENLHTLKDNTGNLTDEALGGKVFDGVNIDYKSKFTKVISRIKLDQYGRFEVVFRDSIS